MLRKIHLVCIILHLADMAGMFIVLHPRIALSVQNRIREDGADLSRLMLEEGAYVYVCGDGNAMAQGVHKALLEVLVKHGGVGGEQGAERVLRGMKERNRYVLDVWS